MVDKLNKNRWKRKISELVAQDIANHILTEDIPEGTVLDSELEMIENYNVGRNTIREALRLLETRGVITIKTGPGGGPVVRRPRHDDLGESLSLILQFANASLADVLEAREALEPILTQLAAKDISDEQLADLDATIEAMQENIEDHNIFLEENRKLHNLIAHASSSIVLRVFVDTLVSLAGGGAVNIRHSKRRRSAVIDAHQKIIDALRKNDGEAAANSMRTHLNEAGGFWRKKYNEVFSQPVKWLQL